jgi:hypothetical protein
MNPLANSDSQNSDPRHMELDTAWQVPNSFQTYDPYWSNQPPPQSYIVVNTPPPPQATLTPFAIMARSMQNMFQMQMNMLRDLETRMTRVEQTRPPQANMGQFYAQTWWALWGILMLILGAALVMVLILILRG